MADLTPLKTLKIDGTAIDIKVNQVGEFVAQLDGEWAKSPSLKGLTDKIKRHVRTSRKIAVPVTLLDDYGPNDMKLTVQQVTLTGVHGGSGNVLARDDKTNEVQQLRYFYGRCVQRLTPAEVAAFTKLVKAQWAAKAAVEAWLEGREVNPTKAVNDAAAALDPALDANTDTEEV